MQCQTSSNQTTSRCVDIRDENGIFLDSLFVSSFLANTMKRRNEKRLTKNPMVEDASRVNKQQSNDLPIKELCMDDEQQMGGRSTEQHPKDFL